MSHRHSIVCELVAVSVEKPPVAETVGVAQGVAAPMAAAIETVVAWEGYVGLDRVYPGAVHAVDVGRMAVRAGPGREVAAECWDEEGRAVVDGRGSWGKSTLVNYY